MSATKSVSVDENENESRRLRARKNLRQFREDVRKDETLKNDSRKLYDKLKESEKYIKDVKDTTSGVLEAQVFHDLAGLCRGQVEMINTNEKKFSTTEFVSCLSEFMNTNVDEGVLQGSRSKWVTFGNAVKHTFRRPPILSYIYGSFPAETEKKTSKVRKPAPAPRLKEAPTKVSKRALDTKDEDNVSYLVHSVFEHLVEACRAKKAKNINFFEFVLDPTSFGQTVENIFHVSFLVKERKVCLLESGENEMPELVLLEGRSEAASEETDQLIMTLNMKQWRGLLEQLNIKEPMIKHGSSSDMNGVSLKKKKKSESSFLTA